MSSLSLPFLLPPHDFFILFSWFLEVLWDTLILWLNITSVFKLTIFSVKNVSLPISDHVQFRSCGIQMNKMLPFNIFVEHFLKTKETSFPFAAGCNPHTFFDQYFKLLYFWTSNRRKSQAFDSLIINASEHNSLSEVTDSIIFFIPYIFYFKIKLFPGIFLVKSYSQSTGRQHACHFTMEDKSVFLSALTIFDLHACCYIIHISPWFPCPY